MKLYNSPKFGLIVQSSIVFLVSVIFLFSNYDTDGYEGDDLNSVVPMFHFEEAKDGLLEIYKYDWQPLSYVLGSFVFKVFGTPDVIFALSPLFIALSILVLFLTCRNIANINGGVFLCFICLAPEIWYTGLYYNSTAAAFFCSALAIYFANSSGIYPSILRSSIIGLFVACSILFRFDFILLSCAIFYIFWSRHGKLNFITFSVISAGAVGLLSLSLGLFDVNELINTYVISKDEIIAKSTMGGWDRYTKNFVMSTLLSPLGYIFIIGGGAIYILKSDRDKQVRIIFFLIGLSPVLLVFRDLLSVKYAMPILIFVPLASIYIYKTLQDMLPHTLRYVLPMILVFSTIFFFFFSVEPLKAPPFITIKISEPTQIGTHDGSRSWGSYFFQISNLRDSNIRELNYIKAQDLLEKILESEDSIYIVEGEQNYFSDSSFGWRYLQLFLTKKGFESFVQSDEIVIFEIDNNIVVLCTDFEKVNMDAFPSSLTQYIL